MSGRTRVPRNDDWLQRIPANVGRVDARQSPGTTRTGSNGTLDMMKPMFQHKVYKTDVEGALAVLRERGVLDESEEGRPHVLKTCRGCGETQRVPLFWLDGEEPVVVVSPYLVRLLGLLICEPCMEKEETALADKRAANDFAARLHASGFPAALAREAEKGWADIVTKAKSADDATRRREARDLIRAWAESADPCTRGVWLHGRAGSGKTKLAATAALVKLRSVQVRWVSVAVLIMQLDGAWNDEDRKAALKVLTDPGVVVLDDADKTLPSARAQLAIFTALEARDKAGHGILVTTNEPPGKLGETWSSPAMSRLVKLATPMAYPGPDMRLEVV